MMVTASLLRFKGAIVTPFCEVALAYVGKLAALSQSPPVHCFSRATLAQVPFPQVLGVTS